jgi:WD40 repeat protein
MRCRFLPDSLYFYLIGSSGYGDAHDEKRLFIADAGSEYKLYCMDTNMKYLRSFPTPTHGSRFPRQVTFGESENVVVGGSKEGTVYVFDTKTGASLDVLHHSSARVLAVAVSLC